MSAKKTKKANVSTKINQVVNTAKESVKNANNYALNTTEEVVLETITIASQWQKVTDKALKGGFKLMANQQNITFDTLDTFKTQFLNGRKRLHKLFA